MVQHGTYCTQIDPTGNGRLRCGGACLASVLLNDGYESDPYELMVRVSDSCGITDVGCTSAQLIACAMAHGLDGRTWVYADECEDALLKGEAVLLLCDNQYLEPRCYPMDYGWEAMHWIRIYHVSPGEQLAYIYDPLCWMPQKDGSVYQGPTASTLEGCLNAVRATGYPEAGVILTSRKGRDLNTPPE